MKLLTIWTMRGMSLSERLSRTGEWLLMAVAHRLPRRLAYWSFIDSGVRLIHDDEEVPAVPFVTVLERMGAWMNDGKCRQ